MSRKLSFVLYTYCLLFNCTRQHFIVLEKKQKTLFSEWCKWWSSTVETSCFIQQAQSLVELFKVCQDGESVKTRKYFMITRYLQTKSQEAQENTKNTLNVPDLNQFPVLDFNWVKHQLPCQSYYFDTPALGSEHQFSRVFTAAWKWTIRRKNNLKYRSECVRYEQRCCGCLDLHHWLGQLAGDNGWLGYWCWHYVGKGTTWSPLQRGQRLQLSRCWLPMATGWEL